MPDPSRPHAMTHAEFLAFEEASELRHAFHDGEVYCMAGGTLMHGTVGTAFVTTLAPLLRARGCGCGCGCGCFAFGPDVRLTPREGDSMYPDASVACPPLSNPSWDPQACAHPLAVVEVRSPTTADGDRGGKFELYPLFPTFKHDLLAHADAWRIQHRERMLDGSWRLTDHGPDDVLHLSALGVDLPVNDIYVPLLVLGGPSRDARSVEKPRCARS